MDFIIRQGGKILVHCHAGQGRTAVLIGAYLIYSGIAKTDKEAIQLTRKGRPKCFSKSSNQSYMTQFIEGLAHHRYLFPDYINFISNGGPLTLKQIMKKQALLLHGEERRFIKFIPKVIYEALERLKDLQNNTNKFSEPLNVKQVLWQFKASHAKDANLKGYQLDKVHEIRQDVNAGHWDKLRSCQDNSLLIQVIIEFIKGLQKPIFSNEEMESLSEISASSGIDRSHTGLLTTIADLISTIIYPKAV